MKIGRVFPDLLTPLGSAASIEDGLARTLRRLVKLTGASAAALVYRPPRERPIVVTAGARALSPSLQAWLASAVTAPARAGRLGPQRSSVARTLRARAAPDGRRAAMLRVPLGPPSMPIGQLLLLGPTSWGASKGPPNLRRERLPAGFPREFGTTIEQVWRLHRRTRRMTVLNGLTNLLVSGDSLDDVFRGFAEGLARLVTFDAMAVALIDAERGEADLIDALARATAGVPRRDCRLPVAGTLLAELVRAASPITIPDVEAPGVPPASREAFVLRGYRSVLMVPLIARGGITGAVILAGERRAAFDEEDTEIVGELARPLASAIEQRRLFEERHRRAEELEALYATSQLITGRLDLASVLDGISRSVTSLIGSTGCGIGLLNPEGTAITHAAAHGFRTKEWSALEIPVGEGIIGGCVAGAAAIRVDDVAADVRSARRDIDEREGIRSMLCVPLASERGIIGVISAFSTRPAAFTEHHQRVLEAFAQQAGIALANARLYEESERRARETRALLEAGRAVTASLDVEETMRVIMAQAKSVLGVASCGIMTLDPETRELVSVASLDLSPELVGKIRVREGEGITGIAVRERRPVGSADLWIDPRVRFRDVQRGTGFRSMLAVPLLLGDRAIGALIVLRTDRHEFSGAEQELLMALADQAAIALEHARLYTQLEGMVAERTHELDAQKRFVEVVLETLPLGVFVLDAGLTVIRVNREGERVLPSDARVGEPFARFVGDGAADLVAWLEDGRSQRQVHRLEREMAVAGETRVVRLTAAPLETAGRAGHLVVLVEDITLAKRLEQQLLLTERLTTAGKLASGVAHELNNPLATIAGCAESLASRLREPGLAGREELADFRQYLGLIEEEAYRCKEITGSLLQFVREPGSRRTPSNLNALVLKVVELLSHQSRFAESRFVTELDPQLPEVTVNDGQLRQVFLGIAANGLEAMDGHGTLAIRTRVAREEVEVEFDDEGPGIPDEVLARIFDPFFTTKPPGQGTGLGLAIAQGIVADHGGRIDVTSRPSKGTVFRVVLPR
jgi:GAF domain-containing protein/nitrogen-specific signal transduction histidine kinase